VSRPAGGPLHRRPAGAQTVERLPGAALGQQRLPEHHDALGVGRAAGGAGERGHRLAGAPERERRSPAHDERLRDLARAAGAGDPGQQGVGGRDALLGRIGGQAQQGHRRAGMAGVGGQHLPVLVGGLDGLAALLERAAEQVLRQQAGRRPLRRAPQRGEGDLGLALEQAAHALHQLALGRARRRAQELVDLAGAATRGGQQRARAAQLGRRLGRGGDLAQQLLGAGDLGALGAPAQRRQQQQLGRAGLERRSAGAGAGGDERLAREQVGRVVIARQLGLEGRQGRARARASAQAR
jgi:hypothetical protein